jgi:hypothetical protein
MLRRQPEDAMSGWRDYSGLIDECKYISIEAIEQIGQWGLLVRIEEIVPGFGPENPERDYVPELAVKIRHEMGQRPQIVARAFEIEFPDAISYHVTNETYGKYPEPPEAFTGKLFRQFQRSLLLDWVKKTTYATDDHPGPMPLMHFEIVGEDDIVDVITTTEPVIRILSGEKN